MALSLRATGDQSPLCLLTDQTTHQTGNSKNDVTNVWTPQVVLAAFTVLVVIFAARKFTQAVKDDIGDKSVFQFQASPPRSQGLVFRCW